MKSIVAIACFFISVPCFSQDNTIPVSVNGIGELKISKTKSELEKIINQPLPLKNLLKKEDWNYDTIQCKYKNADVELVLEKNYMDNKPGEIILRQVKSGDKSVKTKSGITIGDDKYKVISTYEGYLMHIVPDFEKKDKTKSEIWLFSDSGDGVIIFSLTNNKVSAIAVTHYEGD